MDKNVHWILTFEILLHRYLAVLRMVKFLSLCTLVTHPLNCFLVIELGKAKYQEGKKEFGA